MTKFIILSAISLTLFSAPRAMAAEVSITIDDFNVHETTLWTGSQRSDEILAALKKHKVKVGLFPVGKYIQSEEDIKLLKKWSKAGHFIGNHTFDHKKYDANVTLEEEKTQIQKGEDFFKPIPGFVKIFRFPMLAEGDTAQKRDDLRVWLKEKGYKNGAVTIDASDWYIDRRLRDKLTTEPKINFKPYRDYYLAHIWDRAQYYNDLSKKVVGREVKHTLLIHFNLLNALFLDDLIQMFKSHGWKVIDASKAFKDPVFENQPKTLPSGQSLIWALAKESGKYEKELRYPGEDDTYEKPKMDALGL